MIPRRMTSLLPKKWKKCSWTMQPLKDIVCSSERNPASIFGTVTVEKRISRQERFPRKKYIGVWRCGTAKSITIIAPFHINVARYKSMKIVKTRYWKLEWMVKPIKMNLFISVSFSITKRRKENNKKEINIYKALNLICFNSIPFLSMTDNVIWHRYVDKDNFADGATISDRATYNGENNGVI